MTVEIIVEGLSDEELARVDALAAQQNATREVMMDALARVGLTAWEQEGVPLPPSDEGGAAR